MWAHMISTIKRSLKANLVTQEKASESLETPEGGAAKEAVKDCEFLCGSGRIDLASKQSQNVNRLGGFKMFQAFFSTKLYICDDEAQWLPSHQEDDIAPPDVAGLKITHEVKVYRQRTRADEVSLWMEPWIAGQRKWFD